MSSSKAEYFRLREAHCRRMAAGATHPAIKEIHETLAGRYAEQATAAHAADAEYQIGGMAARRERNVRSL